MTSPKRKYSLGRCKNVHALGSLIIVSLDDEDFVGRGRVKKLSREGTKLFSNIFLKNDLHSNTNTNVKKQSRTFKADLISLRKECSVSNCCSESSLMSQSSVIFWSCFISPAVNCRENVVTFTKSQKICEKNTRCIQYNPYSSKDKIVK